MEPFTSPSRSQQTSLAPAKHTGKGWLARLPPPNFPWLEQLPCHSSSRYLAGKTPLGPYPSPGQRKGLCLIERLLATMEL